MQLGVAPKQRGLFLASTGLALALCLLALLSAIGFVTITWRQWALTAGTVAVAIGTVWTVLRFAPGLWRRSDPHFVVVPSILVICVLTELIWVAPEIRTLILVVWPVVLIFQAGYTDFRGAGLQSAVMAAGYLAAVIAADPPGLRLDAEGVVVLVFLSTMVFAGLVLARIRKQRLALAAARAELARLVATDPLTELPNRRHFESILNAEATRVNRYGGEFSLALLDLDDFKHVNDQYGHPVGDAVLRELAGVMRSQLRACDCLARLGGEEFGIVLVATDCRQARVMVERLRLHIQNHRFASIPHPAAILTASIGLASRIGSDEPLSAFYTRTDRALYQAKESGRNRTVVADPGDDFVGISAAGADMRSGNTFLGAH
ncbi:MAG TPA: GGDEF domain-containing protein [Longimicrobiaceae bacterium]|nr:GGDEF domain-containing protein [Longimicrobiaceae bacterium]